MALVTIKNITKSGISIPPPFNYYLASNQSNTTSVPTFAFGDNPAVAKLVNEGYITLSVANDPNTPDTMEPAVVSQAGGGSSSVVTDTANGLAPQMNGIPSQVLVDDGNTNPAWRLLSLDDILPAFSASLSGGGVVEIGQSVVNPNFTASYTTPATSASLADDQGNSPQSLTAPYTAGTMPFTYTKTANNAQVNFTLTAHKNSITKTSSVSEAWQPKVFHGTSTSDGTGANSAFINALQHSALQSSRNVTFNEAPGAGEYIYFAAPTSYGTPTFTVGGFAGGFQLIGTISVTNTFSVIQNYDLWRSVNPNLGSTTVVVS